MSGFSVGEKVQIRVDGDYIYNGVTGTIEDFSDITSVPQSYIIGLDVGGTVVASEQYLVVPGTPGGTYTFRSKWVPVSGERGEARDG